MSPSRPDPYSVFVCVRLLLLSGSFRRRRFSLSLSLSGAGEPQTFLVWGSPCVSSSWTRSPPSIRTSSSSPTPRHRPAPVFFFVVARFRLGVFSFLVLSVSVVLVGGFLSLVLVFVGPATPPALAALCLSASRLTRPLLGVVGGTR